MSSTDATLTPDQSRVMHTIAEHISDTGAHHRPLTNSVIAESLPEYDEVVVLRALTALHSLGYLDISGTERNPTIDGITNLGRDWLATG